MQGRIIKIVSNQYTVLLQDERIVPCVAMGKVRLQIQPVVGDFVEVDQLEGQLGIQKVLERKNQMIRPAIANVDQVLIVMSCKEPDFSSLLVDRLLFLVQHAGIEPVIIITKMDLAVANDTIYQDIADYQKSGYSVVLCQMDQLDNELAKVLKGKVTVLTGQSGVGKSSLLNRLNPDFQIQTQKISKALGRGKHTTRHTELHQVAQGWVADTPGFSSLDFSHMSAEELAASVREFQPYLNQCRFRNCHHINEPGCAIKTALEKKEISEVRYQHYLEVYQMIKNRKERY